MQKIELRLNIQNPSLRHRIREFLERLQPTEHRQEPYCDYAFKFIRNKETIFIKQYQKGTLQIQGSAGKLYKEIMDYIDSISNPYSKTERPKGVSPELPPVSLSNLQEIPLPHIGTDESGKGDYFGPMVVAGVFLDSKLKSILEGLPIKDSKLLSDKRCHELASKIREIGRGKYEEVEIPPLRYNELYENFRKEGKNLNHLLAWGHARAIESLLNRHPCPFAIADQFGDEHYLRSRLMEKGRQIQLIQTPKGERHLAVAIASILARDKFLLRLKRLSEEYQIELPKGTSEAVIQAGKIIIEKKGADTLAKVAKLHHKTTQKIYERLKKI